ncbi:hypothetical protein BDA99DRAFT_517822 [Phascolomyces articulosus]|uniref:Uncharacterized protein n=1 Tax=Phascolomyces articulosus TaxID=60185 RepID=A0AAD5PAX4_9FUNG|nr:hypothetical protein BDA99DRAFT_517822 [Phascolomyces articulosus]
MDSISSIHSSQDVAVILGLNIPLLIFGVGIVITSCCFKSPGASTYARIYNGVFFLTLLLLLACIFSILSVLYPIDPSRFALASHYVDYAIPIWIWWIVYDISVLVRGPEHPKENQKIKYSKKSVGASPIIFLLSFIVIAGICAGITLSPTTSSGIGLIWLNFAPLLHLLIFIMFIKSYFRQMRLLGLSYGVLIGLVVFGNTLGSLLVGVLSLISPTVPFYTVSLVQFVITTIMIRYTLVVALVTVLIAFPRAWVYHIRAVEAQFDLMMTPEEQQLQDDEENAEKNNNDTLSQQRPAGAQHDAGQQRVSPTFNNNYPMVMYYVFSLVLHYIYGYCTNFSMVISFI